MDRSDIITPRWLGGRDAGIYLGKSRDWVEVRALPWQDDPIPGKIRYGVDRDNLERRYFVADLDSMVVRPGQGKQSIPRPVFGALASTKA
jgi:hypothetical protein